MGASTRKVMTQIGMIKAVQEAGGEVAILDRERWVRVSTGGKFWKHVRFAKRALDAECIIYCACLKTHRLAQFTMSLKLTDGFTQPRQRIYQHMGHTPEKMVDLNGVVNPALILIDGRKAFITGGPAVGEVREPGILIASGDRVAADVEGVKILQSYSGCTLRGKDPWHLRQIKHACELGIGVTKESSYLVTGDVN